MISQNQVLSFDSLPTAAQRWLARALPADVTPPTSIHLHQEGSMDIRGRWTPFTAHGIYHANPLSFTWIARLRLMPGVWVKAEDGHAAGNGWGGAKLWGLIPMGQRIDPEVLITQLIRNLGELPWLPPFALTIPNLRWTAAGDSTFEIHHQAAGKVRFEINQDGDILRATSPGRPYDVPDGYAEAPWHIEFSDHRDFKGLRLPGAAVARFEKSEGTWEYFRGRLTDISLT